MLNIHTGVEFHQNMNVLGNCNIRSIFAEKNVMIDRADIEYEGFRLF